MPGFRMCGSNVGALPANVETARRHRWKVTSIKPGEGGRNTDQISAYAYRATRPQEEIDAITVHHGEDEIYLPGKHRWKPVDISFYEVLSDKGGINLVCKYFYIWRRTVVDANSNIGRPHFYRGYVRYALTHGCDEESFVYHLMEAWPTLVVGSDLDYTNSEISDTTVTFKFDKAIESLPVQ